MIKKSRGTALVTGGARRLGAAMSMYLAKIGYDVVIHYKTAAKEAAMLQKKIVRETGVNCQIMFADLGDDVSVHELAYKMKKEFPNWNLLINNASIFKQSKFLKDGIKDLKNNLDIHLWAAVILTEQLADHCQRKKIDGNIINMLDKNIVRFDTKYFSYLLSKKFLAEFTKMAALELAPQIRVNAIAPGFILNSIDEVNSYKQTEELIAKIPLRKKGNEDQIFLALEYLLINEFVTGEILFIDGGASLNHAG